MVNAFRFNLACSLFMINYVLFLFMDEDSIFDTFRFNLACSWFMINHDKLCVTSFLIFTIHVHIL